MEKTIIKISTFDSECSGVILPCNYKSYEKNHFIVMTVRHLLSDLSGIEKENISDYIRLEKYERNRDSFNYSIVDYYIAESRMPEDDIFCLLIKSDDIEINPTSIELLEDETISNDIETYFYPAILRNEFVAKQMKFAGKLNYIYDTNLGMQSYRIIDDYHHYSSMSDLQVLEGMSGAPVYLKNGNLLGVNQSIPFSQRGENPFKVVNYITIYHIFKYLRERGCIIFELNQGSVKIQWINDKDFRGKSDLSILVVGSSGAGKSSLIKNFSLHKNYIDSSGDGQTTRTDVKYHFKLYEENPNVNVIFMDCEEFIERRKPRIMLNIVSLIFCKRFGFEYQDIEKDMHCYANLIYKKFIKKINVHKELEDYKKKIEIDELKFDFHSLGLEKAQLIRLEEVVLSILSCNDSDIVEKKYFEVFNLLADIFLSFTKITTMVLFNNNFLESIINRIERESFEKRKPVRDILEILEDDHLEDNACIDKILEADLHYNDNEDFDLIELFTTVNLLKNGINDPLDFIKVRNEILGLLYEHRGYYSLKEFDFLVDGNIEKGIIKENPKMNSLLSQLEYLIHSGKVSESLKKELTENSLINEDIEVCLEFIYCHIKSGINKYLKNDFRNIDILRGSDDLKSTMILNFTFGNMSPKENILLKKMLKTVRNTNDNGKSNIESLTGIIKSVEIVDSVSNDYAYMLHEMDILSIQFFDTYGLDHIEKGSDKELVLRNFITDQKEIREGEGSTAERGIDSVFYVKKLDSGKPTELEQMIPIIYDVEPSTALYCIFTGADIIYSNTEQDIIDFSKLSTRLPKAIDFLYSKEMNEQVFNKLGFSNQKNAIVRKTFLNNIAGVCNLDNHSFKISNRLNIKRILTSIMLKESDSINFINEAVIKKLEDAKKITFSNSNVNSESISGTEFEAFEIKLALRRLVLNFFKEASIKNWSYYHGNTTKANANRLNRKEKVRELGYSGVYRHRWDMIFNDAYSKVFKRDSSEFVSTLMSGNKDSGHVKVESIMNNLREDFIGVGYSLRYVGKYESSKFSNYLKEAYSGKDINPFNTDNKSDQKLKLLEAITYMNTATNFLRLVLESENDLENFVNLYLDLLIEKLRKEEEKNIKLLLKYNKNIRKSILNLNAEVKDVFEVDNTSISSEKMNYITKSFQVGLEKPTKVY